MILKSLTYLIKPKDAGIQGKHLPEQRRRHNLRRQRRSQTRATNDPQEQRLRPRVPSHPLPDGQVRDHRVGPEAAVPLIHLEKHLRPLREVEAERPRRML